MLINKAPELLDGIVEVDETYVGGKESNKHASKRKVQPGTGGKTMTTTIHEISEIILFNPNVSIICFCTKT